MPINVTSSAPAAAAEISVSQADGASDLRSAYEAECRKTKVNPDDRRPRADNGKARKKSRKTAATIQGNLLATAAHQAREQAVMRLVGTAARAASSGASSSGEGASRSHGGVSSDTSGTSSSTTDRSREAATPHDAHGETRTAASDMNAAVRSTEQDVRADAKKAPAGAQANDASVARDAMPTNAAPQAPRTMMSAASMSARGQATSGSTRRAQTAMSRGLNAAATNDVRPSEGSSLRYSFRTWNEQPSVELRFDSNLAAQTMTAHASHDRVANAMQQHASLLSSDVTLRFERQQADDQGKNPHGSNEQQDAEEQ